MVSLPDWRDASAYEWLKDAGPACFAREWLRRRSHYRDCWKQPGAASRFGLVVADDPDFDARSAAQQSIARGLFAPLVPEARWRNEAASLQLRVQRLAELRRAALARDVRTWFRRSVDHAPTLERMPPNR